MDPFLSVDNPPNFAKTATVAGLVAAFGAVVAAVGYAKSSSRKLPLPPGPPGLPIVGNAFSVPNDGFWLKYKEWADQYNSDIIYLNMLGTPVIVLNSLAACRELLEARSSIYSSRPNMPMMIDLIGFGWHFGFQPYGEGWKERRKIFQRALHPSRTGVYRPQLLKAARTFLVQLLDDPDNCLRHGRTLAGAFILDISYGIDVKSDDDVYIVQAELGMEAMAAAGTASSYLVDFIPSLKYLPSWFPGAKFQNEAREWRRNVLAMPRDCLRFAEESIKRGDARPSVASNLLEELTADDPAIINEKRSEIHDVLGSAYAAGSDTVVSSFSTFFLAMAQNPHIQKKGQKAVDEAISELGRLPDFTDYQTLPYIEAIVREVLRWRTVTPVGVPHMLIQDDVYNGYHIPAGSTILSNCWAIAHDPGLYGPNPAIFDPSRFMNEAQTEINPDMPMGYETFGYGRRICPGLQIAVETLWLVMVSVLATFDVGPVEEPDASFGKYTSGMLIHPYPFKQRITPRSEDAVYLIRNGLITSV